MSRMNLKMTMQSEHKQNENQKRKVWEKESLGCEEKSVAKEGLVVLWEPGRIGYGGKKEGVTKRTYIGGYGSTTNRCG